jgi:hypothetical protein
VLLLQVTLLLSWLRSVRLSPTTGSATKTPLQPSRCRTLHYSNIEPQTSDNSLNLDSCLDLAELLHASARVWHATRSHFGQHVRLTLSPKRPSNIANHRHNHKHNHYHRHFLRHSSTRIDIVCSCNVGVDLTEFAKLCAVVCDA